MEDRPDPLYDSPTYLMFETVRLVRRTAAQMFPGQPRMPQLLVLWCVARHGPLSQREVAERLRMDAGDLVGIVDALEDAGHVRRRRDPDDRRRYALEATEDGRLSLGEGLDARLRLNEILFEPLSPEERLLFRDMLLRVLAHHDERFTEEPEPGRPAPAEGLGGRPPTADRAGQQTGAGLPSGSRASS
ncbi:MarR family winged helix-turn-helix transcriptional regulator [Spirillospora sp. CA-142024]|uniref:MarR family winged helix-turn-helix transcriptional regulator n=1 Tax=Spirillospora sp. CA-142024 TaxID=3240036 RepID=UPI003D8C9173